MRKTKWESFPPNPQYFRAKQPIFETTIKLPRDAESTWIKQTFQGILNGFTEYEVLN